MAVMKMLFDSGFQTKTLVLLLPFLGLLLSAAALCSAVSKSELPAVKFWNDTACGKLEMCPLQRLQLEMNQEQTSLHDESSSGGWYVPHNLPGLTGPCNIKKVNTTLGQQGFLDNFAYSEPVILTGFGDQSLFRAHASREKLLASHGQDVITVTTANTYSYPKVEMTLTDYVKKAMKPQTFGKLGSDTLYHFGDNDRDAWDDLFSLYRLPPYFVPGLEPVISFGLAGPGTGVPFHIHGATYAELIYGRKRWFLYPPDHHPPFDPNVSTLDWLMETYPNLEQDDKPLECVLHPGEILYFPDFWWHATLNVDAAVFVSTFLA